MKAVHYVQITMFMLASVAQSAMVAMPQYAGVEQAVLHMSTALMMTLGLIGGSAMPSLPNVDPLAGMPGPQPLPATEAVVTSPAKPHDGT